MATKATLLSGACALLGEFDHSIFVRLSYRTAIGGKDYDHHVLVLQISQRMGVAVDSWQNGPCRGGVPDAELAIVFSGLGILSNEEPRDGQEDDCMTSHEISSCERAFRKEP